MSGIRDSNLHPCIYVNRFHGVTLLPPTPHSPPTDTRERKRERERERERERVIGLN